MDQPGTGDSGYMVVCRLWFPAARVVQVLLQKSDHLVLKLCAVSDNVPTIIHFPNQPTQLQKAWVVAWLSHNLHMNQKRVRQLGMA